jgi:hypothetical protein
MSITTNPVTDLVPPVTSNSIDPNSDQTPVTTNTPGGVSGAATTLNSAASLTAPAESTGFSASISACIKGIVDAVRSVLARLPLIGGLFAFTEAVTTPQSTSLNTQPNTLPLTDAEKADLIKAYFISVPGVTNLEVPADDSVQNCLDMFGQIQSVASKLDVFKSVILADNSNQGIAKRFYDALPVFMQRIFKEQIWIANNRDDNNMGEGFGDHIVDTDIKGPLARAAIDGLIQVAALIAQMQSNNA